MLNFLENALPSVMKGDEEPVVPITSNEDIDKDVVIDSDNDYDRA